MHSSLEDALEGYGHVGRMCFEYKDCLHINDKFYHSSEDICNCSDFTPDNLLTLEKLSEQMV